MLASWIVNKSPNSSYLGNKVQNHDEWFENDIGFLMVSPFTPCRVWNYGFEVTMRSWPFQFR